MSDDFTVDLTRETMDDIVLISLRDNRRYLQSELDACERGEWFQPEDIEKNKQLIYCLDVLIKYYGG
jgi:hypothetical protein